MRKIKGRIFLLSSLLFLLIPLQFLQAVESEEPMLNDISASELNTTFMVIEEDGSIKEYEADPEPYEPDAYQVVKSVGNQEEVVEHFDNEEQAQELVDTQKRFRSVAQYSVEPVYETRVANYGVAKLKGTFYYKNSVTGGTDILASSSASDAAYLSTNSDGTVRVKLAEAIINVPAANVQVSEYTSSSLVSYYYVTNGKLYHSYYYNNFASKASTQVGYQPSYLSPNVNYYSYDGHYFYTSYTKMIDDYRNNTYANAVNAKMPYYNYYEFLSHRAPSSFTGSDLNTYFNSKKQNTSSKLYNQGNAFINTQNKYGVNASLMYGTAIVESGWGTSKYAMDRNNLFGHNASDSNPDAATRYSSVQACLEAHGKNYISAGYLDPEDYRYRGPHLGNKNSGVSSKYASDPYTGEKKAYFSYEIDELVKKNDYNKYQLAITHERLPIYNSTNGNKKVLYYTGTGSYKTALSNFPFTIIGSETGSDGKLYYKIYSDPVLNASRTGLDVFNTINYDRDYAYVEASKLSIVNTGGTVLSKAGLYSVGNNVYGFKVGSNVSSIVNTIQSTSPGALISIKDKSGKVITNATIATNMSITIKENNVNKTYTVVIRGDTNGDGRISALDYAIIKNDILKISRLSGAYALAADVNKDNKISTMDYAFVKNQILNISNINQ